MSITLLLLVVQGCQIIFGQECIESTLKCIHRRISFNFRKNLPETREALDEICREQNAYYECLLKVQESKISAEDAVSVDRSNMLQAEYMLNELCTDGFKARTSYLKNAPCINKQKTDVCISPEFLIILLANEKSPTRCSVHDKVKSCISLMLTMNCGAEAGFVYQRLVHIANDGDMHCNSGEDLREIFSILRIGEENKFSRRLGKQTKSYTDETHPINNVETNAEREDASFEPKLDDLKLLYKLEIGKDEHDIPNKDILNYPDGELNSYRKSKDFKSIKNIAPSLDFEASEEFEDTKDCSKMEQTLKNSSDMTSGLDADEIRVHAGKYDSNKIFNFEFQNKILEGLEKLEIDQELNFQEHIDERVERDQSLNLNEQDQDFVSQTNADEQLTPTEYSSNFVPENEVETILEEENKSIRENSFEQFKLEMHEEIFNGNDYSGDVPDTKYDYQLLLVVDNENEKAVENEVGSTSENEYLILDEAKNKRAESLMYTPIEIIKQADESDVYDIHSTESGDYLKKITAGDSQFVIDSTVQSVLDDLMLTDENFESEVLESSNKIKTSKHNSRRANTDLRTDVKSKDYDDQEMLRNHGSGISEDSPFENLEHTKSYLFGDNTILISDDMQESPLIQDEVYVSHVLKVPEERANPDFKKEISEHQITEDVKNKDSILIKMTPTTDNENYGILKKQMAIMPVVYESDIGSGDEKYLNEGKALREITSGNEQVVIVANPAVHYEDLYIPTDKVPNTNIQENVTEPMGNDFLPEDSSKDPEDYIMVSLENLDNDMRDEMVTAEKDTVISNGQLNEGLICNEVNCSRNSEAKAGL